MSLSPSVLPSSILPTSHSILIDTKEYMLEMLRKFRTLNYDYHNIGWYQSSYLGGHVDKNFLESQLSYQSTLEESIVLAYGESTPHAC